MVWLCSQHLLNNQQIMVLIPITGMVFLGFSLAILPYLTDVLFLFVSGILFIVRKNWVAQCPVEGISIFAMNTQNYFLMEAQTSYLYFAYKIWHVNSRMCALNPTTIKELSRLLILWITETITFQKVIILLYLDIFY